MPPTPMSGMTWSLISKSQYLPRNSYGGSEDQIPRIMSIDSSSIAMRSWSSTLNISKSGGAAPGPMPNMNRPFAM